MKNKFGLIMISALLLGGCASTGTSPNGGDAWQNPDQTAQDSARIVSYSLEFKSFTEKDVEMLEDDIMRFSGYRDHSLVKSGGSFHSYRYESTENSAYLKRELRRTLENAGMEARISFEENAFKIIKEASVHHPEPDEDIDDAPPTERPRRRDVPKNRDEWRNLGEALKGRVKDKIGQDKYDRLKNKDWKAIDF